MSPVVTLLALIVGLALAVVVLATLLAGTLRGRRAWLFVTLGVVLAVLVVPLPAAVRDRANAGTEQRRTYGAYDEQGAHRKCLQDFSRPDLVGLVDFARVKMAEDAEFRLVPQTGVTACLAFNLLPRRPVPRGELDTARHWVIYDRAVPESVQGEIDAERSVPELERRYLEFQPGLILARPASEVAR